MYKKRGGKAFTLQALHQLTTTFLGPWISTIMSETLHNTGPVKVHWYRSTFFNATILGITNFLAPGMYNLFCPGLCERLAEFTQESGVL